MSEGKKELLNKVDEGKRDFMRKLAIGSAYAVPVMASFPLDSIRNKAWAQAVYGPPRVISVRAVAASAFLNSAAFPAGQVSSSKAAYTAACVITFDRPMNKDHKTALWFETRPYPVSPCADPDPRSLSQAVVGECRDLSWVDYCSNDPSWMWNADGSELARGLFFCQGLSVMLEVVLNPGENCTETPFQDPAGGRLCSLLRRGAKPRL
jgi:hypothetical protein